MKVVTWQAPNGEQKNICGKCQKKMKKEDSWPRNESGEHCSISHGKHNGSCDFCEN